jgi:hypothetical protein
MGKRELSARKTWQDYSGENAGAAEKGFFAFFQKEFQNTDFQIRPKPREFTNIYNEVVLPDAVMGEIYNPGREYKHGIIPDYAIDNAKTNKHLFVEVKRQDGWVEGKEMSAGRGNAHERGCKLFTPGLLKIMRAKGNLGPDLLPFWIVYQGDIARDPKRNREIYCWFDGVEQNFFMWRDSSDSGQLIAHFNKYFREQMMAP